MKIRKLAYIAVVVLLALIFGFSAYRVGDYVLESRKARKEFEELAAMKEQAAQQASAPEETEAMEDEEPDAPGEETTEATEPGILADYAPFYEANPHVVGWIKIDGTVVDYPVMQTPEHRDYYLKRNFEGERSEHGCIYIREECDMNEPSDNITVYGHNMNDGSMFACLLDYEDKKTWEQNSLIFFDTLTEYHTYKIFAVFKTTASLNAGFKYHNMIDAPSKEAFDEFIATAKALSFYDTGITPKYGDKIICLSTCEYTLANGRLVVAAVRIS